MAEPIQCKLSDVCALIFKGDPVHGTHKKTWRDKLVHIFFKASRINCEIHGIDNLKKLSDLGACVVIGNHPFGAPEAGASVGLLHSVRPDFRILAWQRENFVPAVSKHFLQIDNKFELRKKLRGHFDEQGCAMVFPSSSAIPEKLAPDTMTGRPVRWKKGAMRMVLGNYTDGRKLPYLPMYFYGVDERPEKPLQTVKHPLIAHMQRFWMTLSSYPKDFKVVIGEIQRPEDFSDIDNVRDMELHMRKSVYSLAPPVLQAQAKASMKII